MINESSVDRTIRVLVGIAVLSLTVIGPKTMLGLVGVIPLTTGIVGFCPLYRLLGINTCSIARR
jgi:Protein of unknown function (DUF2892)